MCGCTVVRDGRIALDIGQGNRLEIPVYLRYQVSGAGKILSLRAHWNMMQVVFRVLTKLPEGFQYLTAAGKRLFQAEGLKGIGGFARAAMNTDVGAKTTVYKLKEYLETGRYSDAVSLFAHKDSDEILLCSEGANAYPAEYLTIGEIKILSVRKLIESRNTVSFRCELEQAGMNRSGVAFCRLAAGGFRIRTLEVFLNLHPAAD